MQFSRDHERKLINPDEVDELADRFESLPPEAVLRWAIGRFGRRLAISTSFQAEGMVILDLAWRIDPTIRIITVDSGRLHAETYDLIERVRNRYQVPVEIYSPSTSALEPFVRREGINPFYRDVGLRLRCCEIRKVAPLARALATVDAWVAGQRRDQGTTRSAIRKVEVDQVHGGLVKLNPLADWSETQVWDYIQANDVPYNPLYDRGFTSIGCAPCTRPTQAGEDPRAGRWWWEQNVPKECGINVSIDTDGFARLHRTGRLDLARGWGQIGAR